MAERTDDVSTPPKNLELSSHMDSGHQVVQSFTDVITSLVKDTATIRELSCLRITTEIDNPIRNNDGEVTPFSNIVISQLKDLNSILSGLESKVSTLQSIVKEEKQSIQSLEGLKRAAEEQNEVVRDICYTCLDNDEIRDYLPGIDDYYEIVSLQQEKVQQSQQQCQPKEAPSSEGGAEGVNANEGVSKCMKNNTIFGNQDNYQEESSNTLHDVTNKYKKQQDVVDHTHNTTISSSSSSLSSSISSNTKRLANHGEAKRRNSKQTMNVIHKKNHNRHSFNNIIYLPSVTKSEFYGVSKNIRGRISLSTLNSALDDIQSAVQKKYNILYSTSSSSHSTISTSLYRETLGIHESNKMIINAFDKYKRDDDENAVVYFITEQELRNDCLFFRKGESTARAILLILRSVKRIQQVVGKNAQACYVCLL